MCRTSICLLGAQYLACLATSSSSNDKLAFDVGLLDPREDAADGGGEGASSANGAGGGGGAGAGGEKERGLTADESCWWTVHPASKQRSEGEKVRFGDDLIFINMSTERYLVCAMLLRSLLS